MVILNDLSKVPKFPRSGICFFSKIQNGRHAETIKKLYHIINLTYFVIPLSHLIFHGELIAILFF